MFGDKMNEGWVPRRSRLHCVPIVADLPPVDRRNFPDADPRQPEHRRNDQLSHSQILKFLQAASPGWRGSNNRIYDCPPSNSSLRPDAVSIHHAGFHPFHQSNVAWMRFGSPLVLNPDLLGPQRSSACCLDGRSAVSFVRDINPPLPSSAPSPQIEPSMPPMTTAGLGGLSHHPYTGPR
jgi:hypothetical protein